MKIRIVIPSTAVLVRLSRSAMPWFVDGANIVITDVVQAGIAGRTDTDAQDAQRFLLGRDIQVMDTGYGPIMTQSKRYPSLVLSSNIETDSTYSFILQTNENAILKDKRIPILILLDEDWFAKNTPGAQRKSIYLASLTSIEDVEATISLTDGEDDIWCQFFQLCSDTLDNVPKRLSWRLKGALSPVPDSGWNIADSLDPNTPIGQRWVKWNQETYPALESRQPRLKLANLMAWISESHDASSWPWGYEIRIRDWVDSGFTSPTPFDDRQKVVDERFKAELVRARKECKGWLTKDVVEGREVYTFIPDPEVIVYDNFSSKFLKSCRIWKLSLRAWLHKDAD